MFIDVIDVQIRLPSRLRLETYGFHVSLFVAHRKFHKTLPQTKKVKFMHVSKFICHIIFHHG